MFGLRLLDAPPFAGVISARMKHRLTHRCDIPLPIDVRPAKNIHINKKVLQEACQWMSVDSENIEIQSVYGMPEGLRGLYWFNPDRDRGHQVRLNADKNGADSGTLLHEIRHCAQSELGFWRPFRLGYEVDAQRWADALEYHFRNVLERV